ncbi:sulfotransferase [Verrucomicrobiaceae bacterium N1E253]|uniref:Sulfotransferase n=1 Tax=Oceaniferula marina TaxID=2748318 RepID=A0A851GJQ0_9BACT|nr:sulfotransferase [Oceaniferula marina]NWK57389.1 sulfotransferase [Oceaniferula marina]
MRKQTAHHQAWTSEDLPELHKARELWEHQPLKALTFFQMAARKHPCNQTALIDAARALGDAHHIREAKALLTKLDHHAKQTPQAAELIGQSYRMAHMPDEALEYLQLAAASPDCLEAVIELVIYYERRHQTERARQWLEPALSKNPTLPALVLLHGRLLRREGEHTKAINQFLNVANEESAHFYHRSEAWYELANIEDAQGDYHSAYRSASKAKDLLRPAAKDMMETDHLWRNRQKEIAEVFSSETLESWKNSTRASKLTPCMLTGCPRSGTTLFERVIGSHPMIQSFDELNIFPRYLHGSMFGHAKAGEDGASAFQRITKASARSAGLKYWKLFAQHSPPNENHRVLLDKNPSATGQLPVFLRMFPHAKILYALRDPRDIAVSCFLRFLPLNSISAHFLDPNTTLDWISKELSYWQGIKQSIPEDQWHEVQYEDTVRNLKQTVMATLKLLDLPWDAQISNYLSTRTQHPVNSPTYLEITQPIHTRSVGRWKHYAFAFEAAFDRHPQLMEQLGDD